MNDIYDLFEERIKHKTKIIKELNSNICFSYNDLKNAIYYLDHIKTTPISLITNTSAKSYLLSIASIFSHQKITLISDQLGKEAIRKITFKDNLIINPDNFDFKSPDIKTISYSSIIFSLKDENFKFNRNQCDNYQTIFLSSGSTGKPKRIPLKLKYFNFCSKSVFEKLSSLNLDSINQYCLHDPSFVIILPYLMFSLKFKCCIVVPHEKALFLEKVVLFKESNCELLISVPSVINSIRNSILNQRNLSVLISCGEPLFKSDAKKNIDKLKPKYFYNFYGSTEVSPWIFALDVNDYLNKFDNEDFILPIGKPLKGCIASTYKNELIVNCKWNFDGYLNEDNSLDKSCFMKYQEKFFYKSSDRIKIFNGFYYCEGRIGLEQKVSGIRINIYEVEAMIMNLNYIKQVVVNIKNNKLKILIFKENEPLKTDLKLEDYLYSHLDKRIPITIDYSETKLKLNKSGKIDRSFYKSISN